MNDEDLQKALAREISIWTVFDSPVDWPGRYVARRFICKAGQSLPTEDILVAYDLSSLRDILLRKGLARIERYPEDRPHIVESWI